MMHRLAICVVFASSSLAAPRPAAAAAATDVYDTVDSVEIDNRPDSPQVPTLVVTGILAGQTRPGTARYFFSSLGSPSDLDTAMHCQRLAVVAMSKPGKFQFAITPPSTNAHGCKLILRTP